MRSRAEGARFALEWMLRGVAFVALLAYVGHTRRMVKEGATERTGTEELSSRLVRWSTVTSPRRAELLLDRAPAARERDWLAAITGAGTSVRWSGRTLRPVAIAVDRVADPVETADVSVAAPAGDMVTLRDTIGVIDSSRVHGVARFRVHHSSRDVDASAGGVDARAARADSLELRRVFLVGQAGWEGKFVLAALEERGWKVDAHLIVSPRGDVRQGSASRLDTARYSAVVAVDSTAARYAQGIARFVRAGGGLVIWSPAARGALATIAPGVAGREIVMQETVVHDTAPRAALDIAPIISITPDAIVLERRGDAVTVAARRVGAGRVIEAGYTNLWRWRMAGGSEAPARHREWMAGLVSSVAYAPRHALVAAPSNPAPVASLIDRLGPASVIARKSVSDPAALLPWLFAATCGALLLEWASRRLRGRR